MLEHVHVCGGKELLAALRRILLEVLFELRAREMSLHSAGTEGIAGAPAAGGAAVPGAFAGAAVPGAASAGAAAAPVSAGVPAAGDTSGMAPFAAKRAVSRPRERKRFSHSSLRVFSPPLPSRNRAT